MDTTEREDYLAERKKRRVAKNTHGIFDDKSPRNEGWVDWGQNVSWEIRLKQSQQIYAMIFHGGFQKHVVALLATSKTTTSTGKILYGNPYRAATFVLKSKSPGKRGCLDPRHHSTTWQYKLFFAMDLKVWQIERKLGKRTNVTLLGILLYYSFWESCK